MPRVMGQNSITRQSKENAVIAYGHETLNLRLGRDQVVRLETAANLCASGRQANNFFRSLFYI